MDLSLVPLPRNPRILWIPDDPQLLGLWFPGVLVLLLEKDKEETHDYEIKESSTSADIGRGHPAISPLCVTTCFVHAGT